MTMIRSNSEKEILMKILGVSCPLPFELKTHTSEQFGDELYYIIPDEDKEKYFKLLWPFSPMPNLDDIMYDVHQEDFIKFKDCFVIRWQGRNIIVSPNYFETGGTCIDLISSKDAQEGISVLTILKH